MKKEYDVERIKYLYEKYGTLSDVTMRMGCTSGTVKRILIENGIEIKPYKAPRWDIKCQGGKA